MGQPAGMTSIGAIARGQRLTGIARLFALFATFWAMPAFGAGDQTPEELAEIDKFNAIWTIAEAEVIAERCPYATVDPHIRADFIARSKIGLTPNSDDSKEYAFRLDDRRDHFWPRNQHQMCMHGVIGYGPHGISVKNLLILTKPYRE